LNELRIQYIKDKKNTTKKRLWEEKRKN
jgi:hypothetical protein